MPISSQQLDTGGYQGVWNSVRDFMSGEEGTTVLLPLLGAGAALVGTMGLGWWFSSQAAAEDKKIDTLFDIDDQTEVEKDGSRHTSYAPGGEHMTVMFDDVTTLYEGLRRGQRVSRDGLALGRRIVNADGTLGAYKWISYDDVIRDSVHLAAGFRKLGLNKDDNFVGIYAKNRPEWIVTEHACYTYRQAVVPLYDTLGPDACTYIINHTELKLIVVDTADKATALLKQKAFTDSLRLLVMIERPSEALMLEAKNEAVQLFHYDDVLQSGRSYVDAPAPTPPTPNDIATICYTSGTTGTPKGVVLTHRNVVADGTTLAYFKHAQLGCDDVMISFLPLAHMFERVLEVVALQCGGKIGYSSGDIRKLAEDIKELQPTIVPAVPRVLNRIYDRVLQESSKSTVKKMLFQWALSSKENELKQSIIRSDGLWDRLVFKKIRDGMGGRVRLMICGSAPLSAEVLTFTRAALGCVVVEGYGQTECVACACITLEGDHTPGHVGVPAPCCSVKLVDVPELGYLTANRQGEVCVKGPNVFQGYYRDAERTSEALDADGWLHTGDIGAWTNAGTLKIVDRKKHIFKLSQGEYVAPEKIENVYLRSKYVAQAFVYGESLRSVLVAIVVPDPLVLPKCAKKLAGDDSVDESTPMGDLCKNEAIRKAILADMTKIGKEAGLHTFEQVKCIHLHAELFSVENNLLTPTLKSKRPDLKTAFIDDIDAMYSTLEPR